MTPAEKRARPAVLTVLAAVGTALAVTVYVVLWVRHGLRGDAADIRLAVVGWVVLAVVVSRLWHRDWLRVAGMVAIAALAAAVWGLGRLNPSEWVDAWFFIGCGLVAVKLAVAAVGGVLLGDRPSATTAVIVVLSEVAQLPFWDPRVSPYVAPYWYTYPFPAMTPALVVATEMVLAAAGAAVLARGWRRRA